MELNDLLQDPEKIKQFIGLLQQFLDTESSAVDNSHTETPSAPTTKTKPNKNKFTNKTNTFVNKFETMSEFRMHKEDVVIDKQLSKHPPVDRSREFDLVDVSCRVCGKKESVPPGLVFEGPARYKCNRCSATSG